MSGLSSKFLRKSTAFPNTLLTFERCYPPFAYFYLDNRPGPIRRPTISFFPFVKITRGKSGKLKLFDGKHSLCIFFVTLKP